MVLGDVGKFPGTVFADMGGTWVPCCHGGSL